jgi:arsenite methyltransferase
MYICTIMHTFMSEEQVKFFKALGDETRLRIVGFLLKEECCACNFKQLDGKDQTTVSRHLKVLTDANIVKFKRSGRNLIYSIKDQAMIERLMAMGIELNDHCCPDSDVARDTMIKESVKETYGKIAVEGGSCGCGDGCGCGSSDPIQVSASLGYSDDELNVMPDSNLGLGCGNPNALGDIKEGDTVLDLGSGAGMDAFIAAKKVGDEGRVIGVDITEEMIERARSIAARHGFTNVEFRHGDIEDLPVDTGSVDVILSNCVINLAPDKSKVFSEAYRVLRPGGSMYISDMVLIEELTEEQKNDKKLITGCIGGAILKDDYLKLILDAGFVVERVNETQGAKEQHKDMPAVSLMVVAKK